MSRLTRFILMAILFITTFFIVSAAEYATFRMVTAPGGDNIQVERVHLTCAEDMTEVCYSDSFDFWGTNFEGLEYTPYRIRSWTKWQWWQNSMAWADKTVNFVEEGVTTIFFPIAQVKELQKFYGYDDITIWAKDYYNVPDELSSEPGDVNYVGNFPEYNNIMAAITDRETGYQITGSKEAWFKQYNDVYNTELKIEKYNEVDAEGIPIYQDFAEKFLVLDTTTGEYTNIKATAAILFYQIFLAIILSGWFVYQSPIGMKRNANNEMEVEGRFLPRLPKFSGLKRKQKREKRK